MYASAKEIDAGAIPVIDVAGLETGRTVAKMPSRIGSGRTGTVP